VDIAGRGVTTSRIAFLPNIPLYPLYLQPPIPIPLSLPPSSNVRSVTTGCKLLLQVDHWRREQGRIWINPPLQVDHDRREWGRGGIGFNFFNLTFIFFILVIFPLKKYFFNLKCVFVCVTFV
jgi:hypothetical protein